MYNLPEPVRIQPADPMEQYARLMQIRQAQQQMQNAPLQRQILEQQAQTGQLQLQQDQQSMHDQQAFRTAMSDPSMQGKTLGDIADVLAQKGSLSQKGYSDLKKADLDHRKSLAEMDEKSLANAKAAHDQTQQLYNNVMNLPDDQVAENWPSIAQQYNAIPGNQKQPLNPNQPLTKAQLQQFGPMLSLGTGYLDSEMKRRSAAVDLQTKEVELPAKQADATIKQQEAQMNPVERAIKGQSALEYFAAKGDPLAQAALQKKIEVAKASRPVINNTGPNDIKDTAQMIADGQASPILTDYSFRDRTALAAQLKRLGYDQAAAAMDWKAVNKQIATLNGPQQTRLRQSIASAGEMLDKVESLYNEWKQLAPQSGFKVINKATLAAMKNSPGRAGAVAQALEAQIADLTADLGNVYMGGNSPTDHALALASKTLAANWNDQTFTEGIKQARANVKIRNNSIMNTQPVGLSGKTDYMPHNETPQQNQGDAFGQFGGKAR